MNYQRYYDFIIILLCGEDMSLGQYSPICSFNACPTLDVIVDLVQEAVAL